MDILFHCAVASFSQQQVLISRFFYTRILCTILISRHIFTTVRKTTNRSIRMLLPLNYVSIRGGAKVLFLEEHIPAIQCVCICARGGPLVSMDYRDREIAAVNKSRSYTHLQRLRAKASKDVNTQFWIAKRTQYMQLEMLNNENTQ